MSIAESHFEEITALIQQLDKLLKVMRHSDPSAEGKRMLLYEKYQQQMSFLAKELKNNYSWSEVKGYLTTDLFKSPSFIEEEILKIISGKLIKDFEKLFFLKPVLKEFSQPSPELKKEQKKPTVTIRRYKRIVPVFQEDENQEKEGMDEERYTREDIMEMAQKSHKKRQAFSELRLLVDAIKRVGPESIETKIIQEVIKKP